MFILIAGIGVAVGFAVGATKTTDSGGFYEISWANMTEQPMGDSDKVFNWLLCSMFGCAAFITATIIWLGGRVTLAGEAGAQAKPSGYSPPAADDRLD
jgi:hypothetical protein